VLFFSNIISSDSDQIFKCYVLDNAWNQYNFITLKSVSFVSALVCRSKVERLIHAARVALSFTDYADIHQVHRLALVFLSNRVPNVATGVYLIMATHP
jgi:hypothetical protein